MKKRSSLAPSEFHGHTDRNHWANIPTCALDFDAFVYADETRLPHGLADSGPVLAAGLLEMTGGTQGLEVDFQVL